MRNCSKHSSYDSYIKLRVHIKYHFCSKCSISNYSGEEIPQLGLKQPLFNMKQLTRPDQEMTENISFNYANRQEYVRKLIIPVITYLNDTKHI